MNRWLQTWMFECPQCGATYLHDRGTQHACYQCPARLRWGVGRTPHSKKVSMGARGKSSTIRHHLPIIFPCDAMTISRDHQFNYEEAGVVVRLSDDAPGIVVAWCA